MVSQRRLGVVSLAAHLLPTRKDIPHARPRFPVIRLIGAAGDSAVVRLANPEPISIDFMKWRVIGPKPAAHLTALSPNSTLISGDPSGCSKGSFVERVLDIPLSIVRSAHVHFPPDSHSHPKPWTVVALLRRDVRSLPSIPLDSVSGTPTSNV